MLPSLILKNFSQIVFDSHLGLSYLKAPVPYILENASIICFNNLFPSIIKLLQFGCWAP